MHKLTRLALVRLVPIHQEPAKPPRELISVVYWWTSLLTLKPRESLQPRFFYNTRNRARRTYNFTLDRCLILFHHERMQFINHMENDFINIYLPLDIKLYGSETVLDNTFLWRSQSRTIWNNTEENYKLTVTTAHDWFLIKIEREGCKIKILIDRAFFCLRIDCSDSQAQIRQALFLRCTFVLTAGHPLPVKHMPSFYPLFFTMRLQELAQAPW